MNYFVFFYIILPIIIAVIIWLIIFSSYQKNKKLRGVSSGLGLALYLISSPEAKTPQGDESQALKNFIAQMEQFLSGLAVLQRKGLAEKLWGNPSFSLEIASHNRGSEIFFHIAFPRMYENLLANQLHGAFPEAKIEKVPDYNIFNVEGATAGAAILNSESQILPIKTYAKLGADPLGAI